MQQKKSRRVSTGERVGGKRGGDGGVGWGLGRVGGEAWGESGVKPLEDISKDIQAMAQIDRMIGKQALGHTLIDSTIQEAGTEVKIITHLSTLQITIKLLQHKKM